MSTGKSIYFFARGQTDGRADMKNLLGGKGANLAEMTNLDIPVPPGFTITTEVCTAFYANGRRWPEGLDEEIRRNMARLEQVTGRRFGDPEKPLLVSVRSGARVSMPGMMDTILNLGLNDRTVQGLARQADERFAYDSYRRFVQMYGNVVLHVSSEEYEKLIEEVKERKGVELDTQLTAADWKELVGRFKALIQQRTGQPFPEEPEEQLFGAINAVFDSWNNPRAIRYREINKIPGDWGTAVNVQTMVFGNLGETSGTGVAFTRDPSTGKNVFYGEYLMNAQGEDVVAGIRTPQPIRTLQEAQPQAYQQLEEIRQKLEAHYRDMMDIEFTIQDGELFMLQCRSGKRTALAAVTIAVDMVKEGLIDKETAIRRVDPEQVEQLLHPMVDPGQELEVLTKGLPASPGAAVGRIVLTADDAEDWADRGERVVLVRTETSPEDIGGMNVAEGILTARGGMTSHAAVVARGMGKCCVAGAGEVRVDTTARQISVNGRVLKEGDWITLNGTTGEVYPGQAKLVEPELSGAFGELMAWADELRTLGVRTNADTPHDAEVARRFGAEGIGLCRTEHMFFGENRIVAVREMILADDEESRRKALAKLLPYQRDDFYGILKVMEGLPVTIRLLDPPLHEFLPHEEEAVDEVARETGKSPAEVRAKVESLKEFNPMLGHRGCRLGVTYPEIYEMQVQAIFEAATRLAKEGLSIHPEVMIPLVGTPEELSFLRERVEKVAREVMEKAGVQVPYKVGTMIEVPRAALVADRIAEGAEFFSFGTNDLTQMTFGFSRDDAGVFLEDYRKKGILRSDPFQTLDQEGVGQLVQMGLERGRKTRPDLKVGICGEHGGDPASVKFCHRTGLDYVSCSPYRVPVARLAAAQARVEERGTPRGDVCRALEPGGRGRDPPPGRHRRGHRGPRRAPAAGPEPHRPLPLPPGEDAVVLGQLRGAVLPLLRVRGRGGRLSLSYDAGRHRLPRGGAAPRPPGGRARGRPGPLGRRPAPGRGAGPPGGAERPGPPLLPGPTGRTGRKPGPRLPGATGHGLGGGGALRPGVCPGRRRVAAHARGATLVQAE
ncbi:pyruvate phosphate dikinase [Limnochorda pilosa]|uniref:Pyruvate, phosphate dikinase n=1 Tax=Limnochorda pilosa TaxID=1555112 RepID=A0A0K2SMH0_LIMPI|nr:pyruvate phosphate dikinase [Limnochorda pilosa]